MKRIVTILLNLFIAGVSIVSWLSMVFAISQNGPLTAGGLFSLKFFTVLSNLFNAAVCLAYAGALAARGRPSFRLRTWKLMGTAAVSLTFFTVMGFLGPVYGFGSMFVGSNFWLHLALPVLSMMSFVLLERDEPLPFRSTLWAVVPMLIYSVGYLGNVLIQGPGDWPNRHDFYGFLLWGWPIGIAIACGLALAIWIIAVLLRKLNGKRVRSEELGVRS